MRKVFVEGPDILVQKMFSDRGWEVVNSPEESDMIVLEGGADIDPSLYGEVQHPKTHFSHHKDTITIKLIEVAEEMCLPVVGICRGGQMLCAHVGEKLFQHVEGCNNILEILSYKDKEYHVSSDHHQAFNINPNSLYAEEIVVSESSGYCKAFYSEGHNMLGYQPHPEWSTKDSSGQDLFFELIKDFIKF